MPRYNYHCPICDQVEEISHSIKEDPICKCTNCDTLMKRQISLDSYVITGGIKGSLEDHKESEHTKKVKDPERAVRSRKRAFGHDAVGDPGMVSDPRHVVKKGRTLGGQQKEIDRDEFIKAAARDPLMLRKAQEALQKSG